MVKEGHLPLDRVERVVRDGDVPCCSGITLRETPRGKICRCEFHCALRGGVVETSLRAGQRFALRGFELDLSPRIRMPVGEPPRINVNRRVSEGLHPTEAE
jgi:hypothetical protein